MTNIEQLKDNDITIQFFKTFGIEPIKYILPLGEADLTWQDGSRIMQEASPEMFKAVEDMLNSEDKKLVKAIYPQITDRVLLELICILGTVIKHFKIPPKLNIEQLKYHILRNCINKSEGISIRVQSLFREEREC